MKADINGWLNANGIYAGLPEMLQKASEAHELYIVTTKQASHPEWPRTLSLYQISLFAKDVLFWTGAIHRGSSQRHGKGTAGL